MVHHSSDERPAKGGSAGVETSELRREATSAQLTIFDALAGVDEPARVARIGARRVEAERWS